MNELITIEPNTAQVYPGTTGINFVVCSVPSESTQMLRNALAVVHTRVSDDLCDSTTALWVATTYDVQVHSVVQSQGEGNVFLSPSQAFLEQIKEEIEQLPPRLAASDAAALLREFVNGPGRMVGTIKDSRWAIFDDEEDGLTLLVHSGRAKRQLSIEFDLDGRTIRLISIDEKMQRSQLVCNIEHVRTLGKRIAWLSAR